MAGYRLLISRSWVRIPSRSPNYPKKTGTLAEIGGRPVLAVFRWVKPGKEFGLVHYPNRGLSYRDPFPRPPAISFRPCRDLTSSPALIRAIESHGLSCAEIASRARISWATVWRLANHLTATVQRGRRRERYR